MTITITRTYDHDADAQAVVHKLKAIGLAEHEISVIAHGDHDHETVGADAMLPEGGSTTGAGATVGATVGGAAGLLTGLGLIAIPGVGPLVAAGWLATMAAGAVTGAVAGAATGGLVGALTSSGVEQSDAETYAEAVRRGAILVSVRTTQETETQVRGIMDAHRPADLVVRRRTWEQEGWTGHDPLANPYTPEQRRDERVRWG